jgi:hypothetical protein
MKKVIQISKTFSETLGGRYVTDGPSSGQEFREKYLKPMFQSLMEGEKLLIDFDGTYGYPTSFLEEAFGGLTRVIGSSKEVLDKLEFKSDEEPGLITEVIGYIENAQARN